MSIATRSLYWGPTRINGRDYFLKKNQEGEGQPAKWVDLAMQIDGMAEMAHLALIDHPQNAGHPALWRPVESFERREGSALEPKIRRKSCHQAPMDD